MCTRPARPEAGALAGKVALGQVTVGNQPLRQAGVEAARDRVFIHADRGDEGPYHQVGLGTGGRVVAGKSPGLPAGTCYQLNSVF
jgi:hypothetical protein